MKKAAETKPSSARLRRRWILAPADDPRRPEAERLAAALRSRI